MPKYNLITDTTFTNVEAESEDAAIDYVKEAYNLNDVDFIIEEVEDKDSRDPWMMIKLDHTDDISTYEESHVTFQSIGIEFIRASKIETLKTRIDKDFKHIKKYLKIKRLKDVYYCMFTGHTYLYTEMIDAVNNAVEVSDDEKDTITRLVLNNKCNCTTVTDVLTLLEENITEGAFD